MNVNHFSEDLIGLKKFATELEDFIKVEKRFVEGSLVISLNAPFGSGKTTFLKMWKNEIKNQSPKDSRPIVVDLNAWESDYYGDPLFAIISGIIESIDKEGKIPKECERLKNLISAAKTVGRTFVTLGNQLVANTTGINALEAVESTKKKQKKDFAPDPFTTYEERKQAMSHLKKCIRDFVNGHQPFVLFLVDELDRCRPDYAISYLETVKHLFDCQGAVFLIAADRHQLKCSAKSAFGEDLNFDEYYRKFIHREATLPAMSDQSCRMITKEYVETYFTNNGERSCRINICESTKAIVELIEAFKPTFRQIQEIFRIVGHISETSTDQNGGLFWLTANAIILMSSLKVNEPTMFDRFGTQRCSPNEAHDLLKQHLSDKSIFEWFGLLLIIGAVEVQENQAFDGILEVVGISTKKEQMDRKTRYIYDHYESYWSNRSDNDSLYTKINEKITQLSKWN